LHPDEQQYRAHVAEVTRLGLQHQVASSHTSFVAIHEGDGGIEVPLVTIDDDLLEG
jgi:hypothetical protein